MGAQKNRLIETVLLNTHNICMDKSLQGYSWIQDFEDDFNEIILASELLWVCLEDNWTFKLEIVVVVFVFNVPPIAKVIWRRGHSLKSHPTDWWSREMNLRPLVYKARGLSTTPRRLLNLKLWIFSGHTASFKFGIWKVKDFVNFELSPIHMFCLRNKKIIIRVHTLN